MSSCRAQSKTWRACTETRKRDGCHALLLCECITHTLHSAADSVESVRNAMSSLFTVGTARA